MNKEEYKGFKTLMGLLKDNGYVLHTFEFNDIFSEWTVDSEDNPTGIRRFGLRVMKDNKIVLPLVEINSYQYNIIIELYKGGVSWTSNNGG